MPLFTYDIIICWHSISMSICVNWYFFSIVPVWCKTVKSGFHRTFATGVACRQGTLTPPDTWSRPFGTCICSTCWDQSFSELVIISPDYALRISLGTFSILLVVSESIKIYYFEIDKKNVIYVFYTPSLYMYVSSYFINSFARYFTDDSSIPETSAWSILLFNLAFDGGSVK